MRNVFLEAGIPLFRTENAARPITGVVSTWTIRISRRVISQWGGNHSRTFSNFVFCVPAPPPRFEARNRRLEMLFSRPDRVCPS